MVRFHGNYCGPNWSAGEVQPSVVSDVDAIDEFDQTCKEHDAAYATGASLKDADLKFAANNMFRGVKQTIAATLVGAQGLIRSRDKPKPIKTTNQKLSTLTLNTRFVDMPKTKQSQPRPSTPRSQMTGARRVQKNGPSQRGASGMQSAVAPVAFSRRVAMEKPRFSTINGETVIRHREYVGTVNNSTTFSATPYALNPGLSNVFPWLTNIAANYDKYRFKSLRFDYVPAVATSTGGRITLAFNYNAGDNTPTSKQQLFSIAPNAEQAVWAELSLPIPVIPETLYTREYLVPGSDIKTFDMGQLIVATDLGSNSNTIGELYVEYECILMKPHPQFVSTTEIYNLTTSSITNLFPSTGGTIYLPNGAWSTSTQANSLTCALSGRWLISYQLSGTGFSDCNLTATSGTITDVGGGETDFNNGPATKHMSIGVYDIVTDATTKTATILLTITGTTAIKFMWWASLLDANTSYSTNT